MVNRILVIEDDLAIKPMWEHIARRNFGPNNLDWAVNVEEAIKLYEEAMLKEQPYSLIVTDIFLAGSETGLDFITHTRERGNTSPVLLVSAASESDLKQSFDKILHPIEVLAKPLSVPKCEKVLERIMPHQNSEQPNRRLS